MKAIIKALVLNQARHRHKDGKDEATEVLYRFPCSQKLNWNPRDIL